MDGETSQHHVDSELVHRSRSCAGGDATSRSLEDEGEEIAAAEDNSVCARAEAGEVLAIDNDDSPKAEVDGGGKEGGSNSQADEINEEVVTGRVKGILVQHDATNVAYDFATEAEEHGSHVAPGLVADAEEEVSEDVETEDAGVEGIATQIRDIIEVGEGQITEGNVAEVVMVVEDGEVAVPGIVVPIKTSKAVRRDE